MKPVYLGFAALIGFLMGAASGALAGYYSEPAVGPKQPGTDPQCPTGYMVGDLTGVLRAPDGSWQPLYSCFLDDPSGLEYIQPTSSKADANGTVNASNP